VAALVAPPSREPPGVLVGYQPPLAVVELSLSGAGVLVLDAAGEPPEEVGRRLRKLLEMYQGGTVFLVVVGGGVELDPALLAADRQAPDPTRVSLFHLEQGGALRRLTGRRAPEVARAAALVPQVAPLSLADVPAIIDRGRRERDEAARFSRALAERPTWVTRALVAACVLLYGLAVLWSGVPSGQLLRGGPSPDVLVAMGANVPALVRQGEIGRLLASVFLHLNTLHLLMNMMALYSFGRFLEAVLGGPRYLIVYGAAGLGGAVASAAVGHAGVSVGASGAIWGLMLAGFALSRSRRNELPALMARQLRQRLVSVLIINIVLSFIPGIDLFAHFGGGAVGFALVASGLLAPPAQSARPRAWVRPLAAVVALAMALSLAASLAEGRPWSAGTTGTAQGPAVFMDEPLAVKAHMLAPNTASPATSKVAEVPAMLSLPLLTVPGTSKPMAVTTQV
jgi:rhomboid protease GluP